VLQSEEVKLQAGVHERSNLEAQVVQQRRDQQGLLEEAAQLQASHEPLKAQLVTLKEHLRELRAFHDRQEAEAQATVCWNAE
jgi:hypothetical protein